MAKKITFTDASQPPNLLEGRVGHLRLERFKAMCDSVEDFYRRTPSVSGLWSMEIYPTESEKELYPQIAASKLGPSRPLWCQRILSPMKAASRILTRRYEPVFMRLAVVKVSLRLA